MQKNRCSGAGTVHEGLPYGRTYHRAATPRVEIMTTPRFKEQNAMSDPTQTLSQALASRGNRRRAAQAIAAAAGSLLLLEAATHQGSPLAFAQDDDDDSSGRGRGRGRGGDDHDNSGPGNAEDAEEAEAAVELPAGSVGSRIVG